MGFFYKRGYILYKDGFRSFQRIGPELGSKGNEANLLEWPLADKSEYASSKLPPKNDVAGPKMYNLILNDFFNLRHVFILCPHPAKNKIFFRHSAA